MEVARVVDEPREDVRHRQGADRRDGVAPAGHAHVLLGLADRPHPRAREQRGEYHTAPSAIGTSAATMTAIQLMSTSCSTSPPL